LVQCEFDVFRRSNSQGKKEEGLSGAWDYPIFGRIVAAEIPQRTISTCEAGRIEKLTLSKPDKLACTPVVNETKQPIDVTNHCHVEMLIHI
jgi:hypothetical protein